jgi:hypothetical protein
MCPLLAQLKIGFFSFFLFAAAVYSTNKAIKAGLKQSIFLDVYTSHRLADKFGVRVIIEIKACRVSASEQIRQITFLEKFNKI